MKIKKILFTVFIITLSLLIVSYFYWNHEQKLPNYPNLTSLSFKKTSIKSSEIKASCQEIDENSMNDAMNYLSSKHSDGWYRINMFINSIPLYYIYLNDSGSRIKIYSNSIIFIFYESGQKIPLGKEIRRDEVQKFVDLLCSKSSLKK